MTMPPPSPDHLEIRSFADAEALETWLRQHDTTHPGIWLRLPKAHNPAPSVTFEQVLELGLAHGWSESTRRTHDDHTYLQRFTPRRARGTTSARNRRIAQRLHAEGRMTEAGRIALGW